MENLGERIKSIRTEMSLTQKQFADALSVSRSFISRLESNKEVPSDSLMKLIGTTYDVSFEWLKTGLGKKQRDKFREEEKQKRENDLLAKLKIKNDKNIRDLYADNWDDAEFASRSIVTLMNILKLPTDTNSRHYFQTQVNLVLNAIERYFSCFIPYNDKNIDLSQVSTQKQELAKLLLDCIPGYIKSAADAFVLEDLDKLLDE